MRESATSSKASNPNQDFSSIVPNLEPNSFANLATTFRSLPPTGRQHKTRERNPEEVIFDGVLTFFGSNPTGTHSLYITNRCSTRVNFPIPKWQNAHDSNRSSSRYQ